MKHRPWCRTVALVVVSAAAAGLIEQVGLVGQARPSARRGARPQVAAAISSPSRLLDVRVETAAAASSTTRIVLANRSQHAVLALDLAAFRGTENVISDRRSSPRNEPLVTAWSEYTFEVAATFDRLVINSVLWDDGSVEGDPGLLADERVFDIGKAAQIRRVMKVLRVYQDLSERQSIADLRARLASLSAVPDVPYLPRTEAGMQQVKAAALEDLMAFEHAHASPDAAVWRTWLDQTITSYEDWLARIAAR
jgi:hypothetical protein